MRDAGLAEGKRARAVPAWKVVLAVLAAAIGPWPWRRRTSKPGGPA